MRKHKFNTTNMKGRGLKFYQRVNAELAHMDSKNEKRRKARKWRTNS